MKAAQEAVQEGRGLPENPVKRILSAGLPICGGDLRSPVVDKAKFMKENRWTIGGRTFIANADGGGLE